MDTESSLVVDIPDLKLAKVGKDRDRERKRGGAWLASGAAGGSAGGGIGGLGGFMGTGMSLAKILVALLVSGIVSVGAWEMGNILAGGAAARGRLGAPKVFSPKDSQYTDLSGVIKAENVIPNSLGYVNNDGLTDEQRAAKRAADEAAARKTAEDAQKQADADAKAKAIADAKAAAAPAPAPEAGAQGTPKKGLAGGRFGALSSGLGGGGSSALSGGAGLSGGITRNFGAGVPNLGGKAQSGGLAGFRAGARPASSRVGPPPHASSNSKGFAKQQLDLSNGMSRSALASGQSETASSTAGSPFDNNANAGTVISGPGVGSGAQPSGTQAGGSSNPTSNTAPVACPNANYSVDANGNCTSQTGSPTGQNAAPYQGLVNTTMILLGIVAVVAMIGMMVPPGFQQIVGAILGMLGAMVAAIGVKIAAMPGGDFMIGAIIGVVGGGITAAGAASAFGLLAGPTAIIAPAAALIASAIGELAAASTKSANMM